MAWTRLIKFQDEDGFIRHGEPLIDSPEDLGRLLETGNLTAHELVGQDLLSMRLTEKIFHVKKLVGPLDPKDVPILRCVGLNYAKHSMIDFICSIQHSMYTMYCGITRCTNIPSQGNGSRSTALSVHFHQTISNSRRLG